MKRSLLLILALLAPFVPAARADAPAACPPDETPTTSVVTDSFDASVEGGYVLVRFDVPDGTTRIELRLCYDQPPSPTAQTPGVSIRNTLDLGVYDPTDGGEFGVGSFRGWGGSSRPRVVISPNEATNGFMPGPTPAGQWAAEIGVAAVAKPHEGNTSGQVNWRLEIRLSSDPAHANNPWQPTFYEAEPAKPAPGWYKGDFHVHAEHSGSAPMRRTFDYAFDVAGLDFITLSDYNTQRHWDEIGRLQTDYPEKLIIRSAEVITYRGHINNHASVQHTDYRAGPVYLYPDLDVPLRPARSPNEIFDDIHGAGGWTQVNHPTTFPATVPGFGNLCRGCSWEYGDAETDWAKVDAMEVQTGPSGWAGHEPAQHNQLLPLEGNEPGPNPFTPLAIEWWDRLRRDGHRITAVGSSDSHRADEQSLLYSPIGHPTTVVFARELSETAVGEAVRAGHAYIKFFSPDGPDLRLEATSSEGETAIMGDEIEGYSVTVTARVLGGLPTPDSVGPRTLHVARDGVPIISLPVTDDEFEISFPALVPGDYRLQLHRGTAIEAITNPITVRAV